MKKPTRIKLDDHRKEVFVNGREICLAPAEYRILNALIKTGATMSRQQLCIALGHSVEQTEISSRTIDQHISRLRIKIGPGIVLTAPTYGYKVSSKYI